MESSEFAFGSTSSEASGMLYQQLAFDPSMVLHLFQRLGSRLSLYSTLVLSTYAIRQVTNTARSITQQSCRRTNEMTLVLSHIYYSTHLYKTAAQAAAPATINPPTHAFPTPPALAAD